MFKKGDEVRLTHYGFTYYGEVVSDTAGERVGTIQYPIEVNCAGETFFFTKEGHPANCIWNSDKLYKLAV